MGRILRHLLLGLTVLALSAGPAAAIPGDVSKYTIIDAAQKAKSPTNDQDQVVRFTTTPTNDVAAVIRKVNTTVRSLDGLLSTDYFFVAPKTCIGGSPRYSLFLDDNANGVWEFPAETAIYGFIGPGPFGSGCVGTYQNQWRHENLTDEKPRWDLTNVGGPALANWDTVKLFFAARPQGEQVVFIKLVEDFCSYNASNCGTSYYDTIEMGDADQTLESWSDTTSGCSREFESAGAC